MDMDTKSYIEDCKCGHMDLSHGPCEPYQCNIITCYCKEFRKKWPNVSYATMKQIIMISFVLFVGAIWIVVKESEY